MPTAKSAARSQPNDDSRNQPRAAENASRGGRSLARISVGVLLGIGLILPTNAVSAPSAEGRASASQCSSWSSTTRPPDYIRVLRRKSGQVERVPFRKYVTTVLGSEWPSYLPQAVVEAGAVASKQFAWFHALGRSRVSARGQCYDVSDGIYDQLYKPRKSHVRSDHYRAVAATWNVRLLRGGQFFMTPYRAGSSRPCGRDRNGNRLYARSAVQCARAGYNYRQILERYYGPNLRIVDGSSGGGAATTRAASSAPTGSSNSDPTGSDRPDAPNKPESGGANEPNSESSSNDEDASRDRNVLEPRTGPLLLRGSWRRIRPSDPLALSYSGTAGSSAMFRFTGRTLQLVGERGPDRGMLDVYVNGTRIARIDLYNATTTASSVFFSRGWDTAATRTVKIVVVGARNRPRAAIDAIRAD